MCPKDTEAMANSLDSDQTALYQTASGADYLKIPKNSDTRKFAVIALNVEQGGFTLE